MVRRSPVLLLVNAGRRHTVAVRVAEGVREVLEVAGAHYKSSRSCCLDLSLPLGPGLICLGEQWEAVGHTGNRIY